MKKMSLLIKIILSIIVILTIVYACVHFFATTPVSFVNDRNHYMLMAINALVLIYLLYRLFSFKKTTQETKVLWAFLLIFISPSMLYYIWSTDDKKVLSEN